MNSEPQAERAKGEGKSGRRRSWLKRLGYVLLGLLVLFLVFHRPILLGAGRVALIKIAARQNVKLELDLAGTIFTNLTVKNVQARPIGESPVHAIDIELVRLDYSLVSLARDGLGEFLRRYEIKNANLILNATKGTKGQRQDLARDLNNLLQQPAFYSDAVSIENFSIVVRSDGGETQAKGIHLLLDPHREGHLRIGRLQIPKLHTWENLACVTTYEDRNFFLKGLELDPEVRVDRFNFDASRRAQKKGSIMLEGQFFGGTAELLLVGNKLRKKGKNLDRSFDGSLKIEVANVSVEQACAYFHVPTPPVGRLARFSLDVAGEPEMPNTWSGRAGAEVESIRAGNLVVDRTGFTATFKDGVATISRAEAAVGENRVSFASTVRLPSSVNEFDRSDASGEFTIVATDLASFAPEMSPPLGGALDGSGSFRFQNRQLKVNAEIHAANAGTESATGSGDISLEVAKQFSREERAAFDNLETKVTAQLSDLRFKTFTVARGNLRAESRNDLVTVHHIDVLQEENSVSAQGTFHLPRPGTTFGDLPLKVAFVIDVPSLESFEIARDGENLRGVLKGKGDIAMSDGAYSGNIAIEGAGFRIGDFRAQRLTIEAATENGMARLGQFALVIDEQNQLEGTGNAKTQKPFVYDAAVSAAVEDLRVFQPLLKVFGHDQALAGSLRLGWKGTGTVSPSRHSGAGNLLLKKGEFGKTKIDEARITSAYTPVSARFSEFHVAAMGAALDTTIDVAERTLRVRDLVLRQGTTPAITGSATIPFDLEHLDDRAAMWPGNEAIEASFKIEKLDLDKFSALSGKALPVSGSVSATLTAAGTLDNPSLALKVAARAIKHKSMEKLGAGAADLELDLADKVMSLAATIKQPEIQPIQLRGTLPLDLRKTIEQKKLDEEAPLELTAKLPRSSLAFVTKLTPELRYVEGNASADVRVSGTIAKPETSGAVVIDIAAARLKNQKMPPIGGLRGTINFAGDEVTVRGFRGDLGGGSFGLSGRIQLAKLTEPIFDLQLTSDDVLLMRNDTLTVRADSEVKIVGPLASAHVSGTVAVTKSRFFREIEILPIELPGRPAPKPRAAPARDGGGVSFPNPPLRDWTFDVAIKSKDPFQIRGNLANGGAIFDLKLRGTGLQPYLDGMVRIENFVASLPFSKLNVTYGYIYFSEEAPFQPRLDLRATSSMRDYNIDVYIYGDAREPQTVFSSEPPLPQEDIVSLLATGTTTQELTGSADVVAGRAAVLVFQKYYRKIFKQREPSEKHSFFERFDFDVGSVDPKTGKQAASARFELGDRFYLIGDLDVEGDFRGQLKYLLRFR